MSIFKEYKSASITYERAKQEKNVITEITREVINNNILKFIPNGESLSLEIQDNHSKHVIHFDETGVSSLLKYLNKFLVPNSSIRETEEKTSSSSSKQSKKM